MKRAVFIGMLWLLLAFLFAAGCAEQAEAPEGPKSPESSVETLRVGGIFALTGFWIAAFDNSIMKMLDEAAIYINEHGGIKVGDTQYMIEIVYEDTESNFDGTASAANRLVYEKEVDFIIGPAEHFTPAATPVTEPAGVLLFPGWYNVVPDEIDANTPYTFGTCQGSLPHGMAVIKSMRRDYPDIKKIAFLSPDDGAIPYIIPHVEKVLKEEGFEPVGDLIPFPNETEDFNPFVARILDLGDEVEAVFVEKSPGPAAVGNITKGLREAGKDYPIFCGSPISVADIATVAGLEAAEGIRTPIATRNDPEMPPVAAELARRITEKYGEDFPLSYQSAISLFVLKEAIEAAQSLDPTVVRDTLESMERIDTIYGPGVLCGEETFGIKHIISHPLPVQIFKDGKPSPGGWIEIGYIP